MARGEKLALQWSPEQISGWLKQQFRPPRHADIHEAIYRSLFVQTRGVLKKELTAQLRTRRQMRHARGGKAKMDKLRTYSIGSLSASDPPRPRIAKFSATGTEIHGASAATIDRMRPVAANATAVLRCSQAIQGRHFDLCCPLAAHRKFWPRARYYGLPDDPGGWQGDAICPQASLKPPT